MMKHAATQSHRLLHESVGLAPEALHAIITHTPAVAIEIFDLEGHVLSWNQAAEMIFGYTEQEALGKKLNELILDEETHERFIEVLLEINDTGRSVGPLEWVFTHKNGNRGYVYSTTFAVPDQKGGKLFACMDVDVTESKRVESELAQSLFQERIARDEARRTVHLRDDFISVASHELKTPLTPLRMQIDLIKALITERFANDLPKVRELVRLLESSQRNVDFLIRLIENMLDVSRVDTSQLDLSLSDLDAAELIERVAGQYEESFKAAKCEVLLDLTPGLRVRWDRLRVEQVVSNLLSNAVKYGKGKSIEIRVKRAGNFVEIRVRDHGIGVSEVDRERIFERFARGVSVESFPGFGMGLYIARVMVDLHGGKIRVESPPGGGSEFVVELPLLS